MGAQLKDGLELRVRRELERLKGVLPILRDGRSPKYQDFNTMWDKPICCGRNISDW